MLIEKELVQNSLIVYLYENDEILIAGEFQLEINDENQPAVIEALLKSPDEDDAGFIMFEAFVQKDEQDTLKESKV